LVDRPIRPTRTKLSGESQLRAFYGQQLVTITANGQEYQQFVDLSSETSGPVSDGVNETKTLEWIQLQDKLRKLGSIKTFY